MTLDDGLARVVEQLDRLCALEVIASTNLELRADGHVRRATKEPADPGVAVYFRLRGKSTVLSCDRWQTVAGNLAAIAAHIDAVRGQERWGVGTIDQAFAGFAALPTPDDWRSVLGHPATRAEAEKQYRTRIRAVHPDLNGSGNADATTQLNAAIAVARKTLP